MTVSYRDPQNVVEELDYRRGRQNGDAGSGDAARVQSGTECESAIPNIQSEAKWRRSEPVEVMGSELLSGEQSVQQVDLKLQRAAFADVTIPISYVVHEYPAKFRK